MKIYFSMWAYRDPTRVGYDSIGADYYLEKPFGFGRNDDQSRYYEAEMPDCTKEVAEDIGERARKLLLTGYYSAQRAVDMVLKNEDK